jgi:adenosylmethionine-8-amino-7-oxononanoate aminotransferase
MISNNELIQQDLKHIWHPCTQMKDLSNHPPLIIQHAKGSYLYTDQGPIIDAISSWWCKSLGHGFPNVINAIKEQLSRFEHVIGANTTHSGIVELGKILFEISGLQHVFFSSDGSSAVEIALKLALHGSARKGYPNRKQFVSLKNSYHGETLATLCISDLGLYKAPYQAYDLKCHFIENIPYISGQKDPLWQIHPIEWSIIEQQLIAIKDNIAAIVVEPIVQGAGGMKCYSPQLLSHLRAFTKAHDIYLIADEIMTGLGRTGEWLACHHANVKPDMICLSKGLTTGTIPMSVVLIDNAIFNLFYHDRCDENAFLHSHTFSKNPLAVQAALTTLQSMQSLNINEMARQLGTQMLRHFSEVAIQSGKLTNIRSIGAIVAGDLVESDKPRIGFRLQQAALERGALVRPIGNTLYWLPPINTEQETIEKLAEITLNSIKAVY